MLKGLRETERRSYSTNGRSSTIQIESPWRQLAADVILWIVLVTILLIFRGVLVEIFRAQMSPTAGFSAIFECFRTGIRFDIQMATYAVLPSLIATGISFGAGVTRWNALIRKTVVIASLSLCYTAFVIDIAYFAEYGDQFNQWIFGLIYDDRSAIFQTIWKTYPIIWFSLGVFLATASSAWALEKLLRFVAKTIAPPRFGRNWAMTFVIVVLLVPAARGSFGRRPIHLKDAARTGDAFLNKIVLNPFSALKYAFIQQRMAKTGAGLEMFLPDRDVIGAVHAIFPGQALSTNLDHYLTCSASGKSVNPDHIFLIVMESYDAWPMEPKFAELGLTTNLQRLGQKGIQARAFLSAGFGTMPSLTAIISGLPYPNLPMNYEASLRDGVSTAIAPVFKRLGYRTRFFYGGYLSWQRLGDFCREQGFDDVFGGDQMSPHITGNEWGVDDEVLFKFVQGQTAQEPTFNVIMTTSYHPPYSVDLKSKGFSENSITQTQIGKSLSAEQVKIYGHLWYADQELGKFVDAMEQKARKPIFAITGDHFSRRFPSDQNPTLYESMAVPFVLYGERALAGVSRPTAIVGGHLDLAPTLLNLCAPANFSYQSFGHDLLDPQREQIAFSIRGVATTNFVVAAQGVPIGEDFYGNQNDDQAEIASLRLRNNQFHALSWWRVMRGATLPVPLARVSAAY